MAMAHTKVIQLVNLFWNGIGQTLAGLVLVFRLVDPTLPIMAVHHGYMHTTLGIIGIFMSLRFGTAKYYCRVLGLAFLFIGLWCAVINNNIYIGHTHIFHADMATTIGHLVFAAVNIFFGFIYRSP